MRIRRTKNDAKGLFPMHCKESSLTVTSDHICTSNCYRCGLEAISLEIRVSDHISSISPAGNNKFLTSCFVIIVDDLLENPG